MRTYIPTFVFFIFVLFSFLVHANWFKFILQYIGTILTFAIFAGFIDGGFFHYAISKQQAIVNSLFAASYFLVLLFSHIKGIKPKILPFVGLIGFSGLSLINTTNILILIIIFEIASLSFLFLAYKMEVDLKNIYSYAIFNAFTTVLLFIGAVGMFLNLQSFDIRVISVGKFHPVMIFVLIGTFLKIGIFPLHLKQFRLLIGINYFSYFIKYCFWIPAVFYIIIKYFVVSNVVPTNILFFICFLFMLTQNFMAYTLKGKKISVPLILLSVFSSMLFVQGSDVAVIIFIKNYLNYLLISMGLFFVLSENDSEDTVILNKFNIALYLILMIGGTGINFLWGFWIQLEIYKYMFAYNHVWILGLIIINSLFALYNIGIHMIKSVKSNGIYESEWGFMRIFLLLLVSVLVFASLCAPQIDKFILELL